MKIYTIKKIEIKNNFETLNFIFSGGYSNYLKALEETKRLNDENKDKKFYYKIFEIEVF